MATPNTAILLSQLTQEANELVGDEFMMIEVAGVHRKIQFANLGLAGAVWSEFGTGSFGGTIIFYNAGNVGIGVNNPAVLLDINADNLASGALPIAMKARSTAGASSCFVIASVARDADDEVGVAFEVSGAKRWYKFFKDSSVADDQDEFIVEKVGLGNVLRMHRSIAGFYWFENLPTSVGAVTNQLWNDAGTIKVSP